MKRDSGYIGFVAGPNVSVESPPGDNGQRLHDRHVRRGSTRVETRQVIAVELQGYGHTADIKRPLSFERMTDDIAALAKGVGLEKADLLGYSLGGGVALQTAIRRPEVVRKAGTYIIILLWYTICEFRFCRRFSIRWVLFSEH